MRTLRQAVMMVSVASAVLATGLAAQDYRAFEQALREADPGEDVFLQVDNAGNGIAFLYIADIWYAMPCYKKQRTAKALMNMWKSHGGITLRIFDRAGENVARPKMFSSDFNVRGCD